MNDKPETQIENTTGMGVFSLAELANMDTSAVKELTSLVPAAGVYHVRGTEVRGGQSQSQDETKPPLFFYNFSAEILSAKLIDKSVDPEAVVGRRLTDSYTLWPAQFNDLIGLLKGRYKTLGLPNTGPRIGGVEGQEPGWLDGIVSHEYDVRVGHYTDKAGNTRARFTYLKPQAAAEAGAEAGAAA